MDKKEKVIRGLECCRQNTPDDPFQQCGACPYNINGIYVEDCRSVLSGDALEVLKELEQKPKREYMRGYEKAWDEIGRR